MKLEDTLGKTISDFCKNRFTDPNINHCAHFVCHFLKLDFEMTCRKLTGNQKPGANVRVHEVFRNCPKVGKFADWQGTGQVLAFVTKKTNVDLEKKEMVNIPYKHIGIYDGTHIYHYANRAEKVTRQSPKEFFDYFESIYPGEQGLFYGTIPRMAAAAAVPAATTLGVAGASVEAELRGTEVFARVNGGAEFWVARMTKYGSRRGLFQRENELNGPLYTPENYTNDFGHWAQVIGVIAVGESQRRFNRLNSYDRARFTFGFFQLAAHTPQDNLILFFRAASQEADFQALYPDLTLVSGRLHSMAGGTARDLEKAYYNPKSKENELSDFMDYLNVSETKIDKPEMQNAAKLVWLTENSAGLRDTQVRTSAEITKRKFRDRYQKWYNLAGVSDTLCTIIADIHHQGRGKRTEVAAALKSSSPKTSLLEIGKANYAERCATLKATVEKLEGNGILGRHTYDPAHGIFVPV